ncbi:MAG: hypothetical protein ABI794_13965 [Betaproteobacteria bacterium]
MPDFRPAACSVVALFAASVFAEDDVAALARLRVEMDVLVSHNHTCSNVVHCRVLPVGYDACGNPTEFLAFNDLRGIRGELEGKIAEYNFIEEESWRGKRRPAGCRAVTSPQPACINNHCALGAESY